VGAVIRLLIFLPVVLCLAYLAIRYGWGSRFPRSTASQMKIVDQICFGPKQSLSVVKLLDRFYLVAVSEQQICLLKELEDYPVSGGVPMIGSHPSLQIRNWLEGWLKRQETKNG